MFKKKDKEKKVKEKKESTQTDLEANKAKENTEYHAGEG